MRRPAAGILFIATLLLGGACNSRNEEMARGAEPMIPDHPASGSAMGGSDPHAGMGGATGPNPHAGMGGATGPNPHAGMGDVGGSDPHAGMGGATGPSPHAGMDVTAPPPAHPGEPEAGGVRWTVPEPFVSEAPASSMRVAQYRVPHTGSDTVDGTLAVFYFGPGQGGTVDDNVDRWVGQVQQADGSDSHARAHTDHRTVHGMRVTVIDVSGRLGGSSMPGMPPTPPIEQGRLLGAIVEGPQGPVFFKLTGPQATLEHARAAFDHLIESFTSSS